jgi:hypothetical protein
VSPTIFQFVHRHTALKALVIALAALADLHLEPFDKAFTTDAPTPCRPPETLYPPPPNLPPACRIVNTNRNSRNAQLRLDTHRDAAAIVAYHNDFAGQDIHIYFIAVAGQRFVDGVIDNLVYLDGAGPRVPCCQYTCPASCGPPPALQNLNIRAVYFWISWFCSIKKPLPPRPRSGLNYQAFPRVPPGKPKCLQKNYCQRFVCRLKQSCGEICER